jgi:hypothetical protein
MGSEKDDGQADAALVQPGMEFRPAQARHAYVKDDAAKSRRVNVSLSASFMSEANGATVLDVSDLYPGRYSQTARKPAPFQFAVRRTEIFRRLHLDSGRTFS